MTSSRPAAPTGAIATWLFACSALVFAMVLLGGITRLTESGLSIVHWRPFTGWLPPMTDAAWAKMFDAYRNYPEFRELNFWMTLEDFKKIFWLEYLHRLLGRIIGLVYFLPFVWFLVRYRLPARLVARLSVLLMLGAGQGVLGWYMVKSGLVDQPSVSQYRLAAHLGLAVLIYGVLLHTAIGLRRGTAFDGGTASGAGVGVVTGLVFVTMIWGAFLAGIDGGTVYNTFPLMDGHLVPPGLASMTPLWANLFENVATVQFLHRALAVVTAIAAVVLWLKHRGSGSAAVAAIGLFAILQFALGVATILSGAQIFIAWAHQAGAMLLFSASVWAWREHS